MKKLLFTATLCLMTLFGLSQDKSIALDTLSLKEFLDGIGSPNSKYLKADIENYDEWGDIIGYMPYDGTTPRVYSFENFVINPVYWKEDSIFYNPWQWENKDDHLGLITAGEYLKTNYNIDTITKISIQNGVIVNSLLSDLKIKKFVGQNLVLNYLRFSNTSIKEIKIYNDPGKKKERELLKKHSTGDFYRGILSFDNCTIDNFVVSLVNPKELVFTDCRFNSFQCNPVNDFLDSETKIELESVTCLGSFNLWVETHYREPASALNFSNSGNISISNSTFNLKEDKNIRGFVSPRSNTVSIGGGINYKLNIDSTLIISSESKSASINFLGAFYGLTLSNCDFQCPLIINGGSIEHVFRFYNNKINSISLYNTTLPEESYNVGISWKQIGNGLNITRKPKKITTYDTDSNETTRLIGEQFFGNKKDIQNEELYSDLLALYNNMYTIYKNRGDRESANPCYAALKQVETRRWKYLFEQNKTFESFFRWQLNSFLSYFTDYGTNPAKAVIKSGWVILLFAIFYLFFPSDWDVSNRSQLLSKVKDLASKNREKSFIATLAFVLYSAFIHILNALTLSLNAFTTLGFGDIPTHGAARYVTIVQGFIGWFLLTIFSVSLINQVLG